MRLRTALALATTLAFATASTAQAQTATLDPNDLKCLVFSFVLANAKEEQTKTAGALAAFYYLGKIDGRSPGVSLDGPIVDVAKDLKPEDVQAMSARCGAELQTRGQSISALGARLTKMSADQQQAQPAAPASPAAAAPAAPKAATPAPKAPAAKKK